MEFGEKLYELRNQVQISQIELDEDLGVSRQTVSKWETETMFPEIGKLIKISEHFNLSTDYLLKETRQKDPVANLDRLVLKFLGSAQDMDVISKELFAIMRKAFLGSLWRWMLWQQRSDQGINIHLTKKYLYFNIYL